jgi:uncharacterized protein YndB with AHSA1/START domain
MPRRDALTSRHVIAIAAPPARIINAFFDPAGLTVWWQAVRSVTTPRPLGVYAVEWAQTDFRDDMLGPLGGVFHGLVMEFKPAREFFVANAHWLPPEGEPVGPMSLQVSCVPNPGTDGGSDPRAFGGVLSVVQSGFEDSERWKRYYEVISSGWTKALGSLKEYLER